MRPETLCHDYLTKLYESFRAERRTPAETAGHILFQSFVKLLSLINLTEDDIFVDLGSGSGYALLQVFLLSPVKHAYGIEISPKLHVQALDAADQVKKDLPHFFAGRKLQFEQGDFLKTSLADATVALAVSTCFGQDLIYPLGKIIENTPTIHTVLSLRPLTNLKRLSLKKIVSVEGTWDSSLCYLYFNEGA